jgi:NitT/TauT family transport system substrate-binding protein
MNTRKTARRALACLLAIITCMSLMLAGCANQGGNAGGTGATGGTGGATGATGGTGGVDGATGGAGLGRPAVIGTMTTEDLLPLWVAEAEGVFAANGLEARIEVFQSAAELSTAVASGAVDFAMTDPMVAASLTASGIPVVLEWVTLGATPEQGRFGIMASPESGARTLADLAGRPIGVGSNTILEYVMDKLMEQAGIPAAQVVKEEIKPIPVRYEMMTSNQVAAAALPGSLLALGEATGMVLVADDTKGKNLSQSVMIVRKALADTPEGSAATDALRKVWDESAKRINDKPAAYRALLAEKIKLPAVIVDTYPVSTYPLAQRPASAMIDPILEWMDAKGYLGVPLKFDQASGTFVSAS